MSPFCERHNIQFLGRETCPSCDNPNPLKTRLDDGPPNSIIKDYGHKRWADLEWEHEKLKTELVETRKTLARLFALVDQGVLVRDISRDAEPGWGIRMLELVSVLYAAKEEIGNG